MQYLQPEQRTRLVVALVLKAAALGLAAVTIALAALRTGPVELYAILLAVGLLALTVAAIIDTRIAVPRYVQPPPVPRQQRRKKRR